MLNLAAEFPDTQFLNALPVEEVCSAVIVRVSTEKCGLDSARMCVLMLVASAL